VTHGDVLDGLPHVASFGEVAEDVFS